MKVQSKLKALLIVAIVLFTAKGFSQEQTVTSSSAIENYDQGFRLGFGVNAAALNSDYFNFGLGGDVRLQYDLTQRASLTLTTGYTHLFGENEVKDLGFIPLKAGFKAFVWENRFYVLGEAGAGFSVTNDYNKTSFLWAPGIGYANDFIDVSIRYEGMNDFKADQIALRIAYGFRL